MRHYLSFNDQGHGVGIHSYSRAVNETTSLRGWPEELALHDEASAHPYVQDTRTRWMADNPAIAKLVAYDCDCPPTETNCQCASRHFHESRLVGGAMVPRFTIAFTVNASAVVAPINRVPGTRVVVRLVSADVPDGTVVLVQQERSVSVMLQDEVPLTFDHGQTPELILVAPGQGLTGRVLVRSPVCKSTELRLRGWADA